MPSETAIEEMIRACAAQCHECVDPPVCVKEFVSRLTAMRGWAQPDANLVADQALKIIGRITGDASLIETDAR